MRALLRRRGFRNLLVAQGVSALGDWMATIAMMVLILDLTGSSAAVGGMLVLRLLPALLAGPLAARTVRRWSRRRTMLAMDAARAGMVVMVPLVPALWWVYLWAFLVEVGGLVFLPARDASVPDLAPEGELPLANGAILASSFGTIPLGAAAFGGVAALERFLPGPWGVLGRGFLLVFVVDAATFLVSYGFVRRLTELDEPLAAAAPARGTPGWGAVAGSPEGPPAAGTVGGGAPSQGFLGSFRIPLVRAVMPAAALASLGIGTLFSAGIVFVRRVLGINDAWFGVLVALFGTGAAAGLAALQVLGRGDRLAVVRGALGLQGAVVSAMSLSPAAAPALLGAAAYGGAVSATLASGMSILQARLTGPDRVLAFAAFHVVIRAGLSLAALGAGLAVDLVGGVRWPLVGRLEPARVVLFTSGLAILAGAALVRAPGGEGP